MAATARHPSTSTISSAAASASARPVDGVITLNCIRATIASGGRLANTLSCWATRISLERAEIAIPTQIDQPASNGVNSSWTSTCEPAKTAESMPGWANRAVAARKIPKIA